jgi:Protein of unknown function (DUF3180)
VRLTRARDLLVAGVIAGVLVRLWLVVAYDSLPPLPRFAGVTLAVLALIEAGYAVNLRARITGRNGARPVPPLTAARAVGVAKASSLFGAIMAGAWIALLTLVLPKRAELVSAAGDTTTAVVGLVCAAVLIAAALWLEYSCRAPRDRSGPDGPGGVPRSD